jgi:phosphatidylethanolamine/phosphatidyl-N-methylethanolamine N-methyltransferase
MSGQSIASLQELVIAPNTKGQLVPPLQPVRAQTAAAQPAPYTAAPAGGGQMTAVQEDKRLNVLRETMHFMRGFVARPRAVASLFPSSARLARAIAQQIDTASRGIVIELGPGTGAVTRALLAQGVSSDRLILIEHNRDFVNLLRFRFPGVSVILASAFDIKVRLQDGNELSAVVSGLPLLNIEDRARRQLIDDCLHLLGPNKPFIQLSYGLKPPAPEQANWRVRKVGWIFRNIPPATVWTYTRRTAPNAERT